MRGEDYVMAFRCALFAFVFAALAILSSAAAAAATNYFEPYNVTYDHRALIIGGNRRMLISAGIHYPRATPLMWPALIAKSKEGGADVIQSYVFWNGHEPVRGQYYFEGRYDLVKFVKLVAAQGLYFHLRIGPYVCAEWNFGGLPVWLRDIPGMQFRTDNVPFKEEMKRFVTTIVDKMKKEKLFSWQGGPIILLQVENEYGNIEKRYGRRGKAYIKWAAEMALGLGAGVPWVMCKQTDAPEHIIDACNGFYCDGFKPNSYNKPSMWTEDWNGWYASWGGRLPHRPVRDNAFAVARFFQRGGSFHNYYMFFGGTNFGRTAGGPLQITSYDYDAPIDEYGILSQPKWGHLKDLHAAIKLCEPALTVVDGAPQYIKLGPNQEAHIYADEVIDTNRTVPESIGTCAAFLANIDEHRSVSVHIFGKVFNLPPWSVSILPDCQNVVFNTAEVGAQESVKSVESGSTFDDKLLLDKEDVYIPDLWMALKEPVGVWGNGSFMTRGILEHLNVTKDYSDYLWYVTRVNVSAEDVASWEEEGNAPLLTIAETRDVARVFVNGKLSGSKVGKWVPFNQEVPLVLGDNKLALLTETVGLQNYGAFLDKDGAGFRGQIKLQGIKSGEVDLSNTVWTYQVGLKGEHMKVYAPEEHKNADWTPMTSDDISSPFTWYKTVFDAPEGTDPVALYLGSMGKGEAWVNGHSLGRYWSRVAPATGCSKWCNYRGAYTEHKCVKNCGLPTQSWYHVPREWLQESQNLLVLFEETGGNPSKIALTLHLTKKVCAQVSENYYPPVSSWAQPNSAVTNAPPVMELRCDEGHYISNIKFASYGTPQGNCQSFSQGKCHAPTSLPLVTQACEGRNNCTINVSNSLFGDPCRGTEKTLAVEAECSSEKMASTRAIM